MSLNLEQRSQRNGFLLARCTSVEAMQALKNELDRTSRKLSEGLLKGWETTRRELEPMQVTEPRAK